MLQKDNAISFMRVFAMITIVFYHCCCLNAGIWKFEGITPRFYTFIANQLAYIGLNCFFLISGILYFRFFSNTSHYSDNVSFIRNKVSRLLSPYIFWGIVLCIIMNDRYSVKELLFGISHLWFLLTLFFIFVIFQFTQKIWNNRALKIDIFILLVLFILDVFLPRLSFLQNAKGQSVLSILAVSTYSPIFFIGMLSEKYSLRNKISIVIKNDFLKMLLILCLLGMGIFFFLFDIWKFKALYQWIPCVLALLIIYSVKSASLKNRFVLGLDKFSMGIYIIHHILLFLFITKMEYFRMWLNEHYLIGPFLLFLLIMPLSYIVILALKRLAPEWICKRILGV